MECTLSTRFSCQCPNCVVGGAVTVDKNKDEHTNDSFSLVFTSTTSSSSTNTITTTMNPDDSTENIDNNQNLSVSSTSSFPLITLPQSSSSSSSSVSASTSTRISTEQEETHQRRLAKKLKWEKKLRRLNFLERASFTSCSGVKNPRRYYSELGNEYYELFNIEKPTALSQKVVTASKTGIFYPKRSETLRSLARKNYTLRGAGMSHFNAHGVPEHMRLHAPFSSRNSHSSSSFDGPHYGKFDDRGVKNYEKKCLHHRDDKSGYIAKQKIKKEERKNRREEEEESEQETFDDEETEESEEEQEDDCDDDWDDEIRGWLYIGHNERLRRGLIGEKEASRAANNNNNSKMYRRKSKKSGKYSLWEDDLYDKEFYLRH